MRAGSAAAPSCTASRSHHQVLSQLRSSRTHRRCPAMHAAAASMAQQQLQAQGAAAGTGTHAQHGAMSAQAGAAAASPGPRPDLVQLPVEPMPRGVFRFRYFDVEQKDVAMRVGTDAMLLGAWSTQHMGAHAAHVLDVGTGSGVLALMAAQRAQPHSRVHAVDVDPTACAQAAANAGGSPLRDQIVVFHATLQQLVAMHQGRAQAQPSTDGDAVAATAPAEDGSAGGTGSAVASSRSMSTAPGLSMGSAGSSEDGGANGGSHSMHGQVLPAQAWLGQAPSQGYDVIISNPPFFERSSKPPVQPQPQGPGKKGKKKKNQQSQVSEGKTTSEAGEGLGAQTASTTTSLSSLSRDEAPDREQQQQQQEGASASGQEEGPETQPGQGSRRAGRVLGARRALARHADAVVQLDAVQGQASSGAVSGTSLSTDGEGQLQPQVQVQEQAGLPFEALAAGAAALLAPGGALFVVLPVMGGESDRFARLAAAQGLRLVRLLRVRTKEKDPCERRRLLMFVKGASSSGSLGGAGCAPSGAQEPSASGPGPSQPPLWEQTGSDGTDLLEEDRSISVREWRYVAHRGCEEHAYSAAYWELTQDFHHPGYYERWAG